MVNIMTNPWKENLKAAKRLFENKEQVKEIIEKQLKPMDDLYLNLEYFGIPDLDELFILNQFHPKNLLMIRYNHQSAQDVQSIVLGGLDLLKKHDTRFKHDTLQDVKNDPNNFWGDVNDRKQYIIYDDVLDEPVYDGRRYTKRELFIQGNQWFDGAFENEFNEQK